MGDAPMLVDKRRLQQSDTAVTRETKRLNIRLESAIK
jgi:hypothetical protein